jgi:hypothetical protein
MKAQGMKKAVGQTSNEHAVGCLIKVVASLGDFKVSYIQYVAVVHP